MGIDISTHSIKVSERVGDGIFFENIGALRPAFIGFVKRIICIMLGIMSTAVFAFEQQQFNVFPCFNGFGSGGGVEVQGDEGGGWVEVQNCAGAYTKVVRQVEAFSCDAVGLFAHAEGGGGRRCAWVCEVKRGENFGGGVVHGFTLRQHGVDTFSVGAYLPESSTPGFSFSPLPFLPGARSDNAQHGLNTLLGVSFSASFSF